MKEKSPRDEAKYLLFVTKQGLVKKTAISEFENIRTSGKISISLRPNDELIAVKKTNGENSILFYGLLHSVDCDFSCTQAVLFPVLSLN